VCHYSAICLLPCHNKKYVFFLKKKEIVKIVEKIRNWKYCIESANLKHLEIIVLLFIIRITILLRSNSKTCATNFQSFFLEQVDEEDKGGTGDSRGNWVENGHW